MNDTLAGASPVDLSLGPLPEPATMGTFPGPHGYSKEQMRTYAAQEVAAERERWRDAINALADEWDDPAEAYGMRLALNEGLKA